MSADKPTLAWAELIADLPPRPPAPPKRAKDLVTGEGGDEMTAPPPFPKPCKDAFSRYNWEWVFNQHMATRREGVDMYYESRKE